MSEYAERPIDSDELCGHYSRHVSAMTAEDLHSKSAIAAELAWRDARIAELEKRTPSEGMALVPREITAEAGHKAGMMSEFSQSIPVWCETCNGEGTIDERLGGEHFSNPKATCPDCDGDGEYERNVNISWTNIKAIHKRAVEIAEDQAT